MANLRIISVVVVSSTSITATFTDNLNEDINTGNITIVSQTPGVPDSIIQQVSIVGNTLVVTCQPLTPLAAYFITFFSTTTQLFNSLNGNSVILNDGITNKQLIYGPLDSDNPIQTYLINFFQNNVYNTDSPSIIYSWIQGLATSLSQALYDIRQAGNENYLSYTVTDELKVRGSGAFDRLDEEGAYEVLRVGVNPTNATVNTITSIASFPSYPVSLLSTNNTENLLIASLDATGTFNLETLTINASKRYLIILNSITFVYSSSLSPYVYNVQDLGYQILDSTYDPDFAFTYFQLTDSQIRLNDKILSDPLFSTENILFVQVSYQYKDTGKIIDPTSLAIDTIISSGREVVPPIENIFTLMHAPIVTTSDTIGNLGSVTFIDPNALPGSNTAHPAFIYEVPYRLDYLPSMPGEYSVDYTTGNVYVFGATTAMDGTGPFPPLANYLYRYTFKSQVDYSYASDSADLVALPLGSLTESQANISYESEEVLAQGIDYNADTHIEVLSENIQNRLTALNSIQPLNFPITDVFRIFNQTTGEIYTPIRWSDTLIYFNYVKAPNIVDITGERASFQDILNELLFVSATSTSGSNTIFKMFLNNNNIMDATDDATGSSINTSVFFSNTTIFQQEIYFESSLTESQNNSRLLNVGEYQIDYKNGVIWCLVPSSQSFSVGTISYKRGYIAPQNPQVITVNDIYYQFSVLSAKIKHFTYTNFSNGSILPSSFDSSDENYFMGNTGLPYTLLGGQVGSFINANFVPGVTSSINFIRGLFEYDDLLNNINPINFASVSTANGMNISVATLSFTEYHSIQFDGTNYYILANTNLLYSSPNIAMNVQITRLSDGLPLNGTVIFGTPFRINLSGFNTPQAGDPIVLVYTYTIQDVSRIVIDYDKGGYWLDYSYLADEIIISYEYGDNVLDFRQSSALSAGDNYYVTYKVGALRDALLANFGTLINIPLLNDLDVSFARESYRDALMAAMQSFPEGPTITSMANIVNTIVHTPPQIIESAFTSWSLGNALLNPETISTTGSFSLVPAKYDNGVLINVQGQTIKFPVSSNLRLEQGTLETWVMPEWNGIDNQSNLSITILKNNIPLSVENIFIGPGSYHPTFDDGYTNQFTINIFDQVSGTPNESKDGVFIYYAPDPSAAFNRWYIDVRDGYGANDGYSIKNYQIIIKTNGYFYDAKSELNPQPPSDLIFSGTKTLTYTITGLSQIITGITFIADYHHYIFDFGKEIGKNRFSIYKDESGYLNFRVIDKKKSVYTISTDISSWSAGELHQVATSWALGAKTGRDEMHLFIDGLEVPNIIKYGNAVLPYPHEKFRTVDPEEIVGVITRPIVSSVDLTTSVGSQLVSSSINFSTVGILSGDTIYIEEPGFLTSGYSIINVNGQTLTLSVPLPISSTNSTYTINKTSFDVLTPIDLYPNIAVSLLHSSYSASDLTANTGSPIVMSSSSNFTSLGITPGYVIVIDAVGFEPVYTVLVVNGNSLTLSDNAPTFISNTTFYLYPDVEQEIPGVNALRPAYSISRDSNDNPVLTILNDADGYDIVLIRTLGINNKIVDQKYYLWNGPANPTPVNTIMTKLPPPILLSDVKITHILLDRYDIGPGNSTLVSNVFYSNEITTDQPSLSDNGRTLSVYISGDNVDYSVPVSVSINGTINGISNSSETLSFTENTTLVTINQFSFVNYISVDCKPINPNQNCVVLQVKEFYPITTPENSTIFPIIRYSYQILAGNTLTGSGTIVTDTNSFFSSQDIGNYLVISSPSSAAGQYQIIDVSADHQSITITGNLPYFNDGIYQVLNTTTYRSGLQNGFFTFELADGYEGDGYVGEPYNLVQGLYEFKYYTYLSIQLDVDRLYGYIGSDFTGNNIFNGVIDEFQTVSQKLIDTRVGETAAINQQTITKDFNSLVALTSSSNTLMLLHFDTFPFQNSASVYITASNEFIQSGIGVNSNFNQSIVITNNPVIIDNTGILHSKTQGTIEFWISPIYDTWNDPNFRYYFDATGMVSEQVVSTNNATVNVAGKVSNVLSIKVLVGNQNIDYFAGGKIDPNGQTLYLNKALPNQQTPVIVNYIPTGTNGDRISIYKDPSGYVNFDVIASGIIYAVRAPVFWTKGSWHRLKATYIFNTGPGTDKIRFFIDGFEWGNNLFGSNILFGQGVLGSSFIGQNTIQTSIIFKDTVNQLFIGSDFTGFNGAYSLIDNLRISDISRPVFLPFGESIDVNYSSNLDVVFPVTTDLYTTLLMDFDTLVTLNTSFSTLKNETTGLFDFTINIFDSFGIVNGSPKVKQVLEELINTLKPANSMVYINYR
jgi:hypothetical protein